jgi:hypothetical protein
MCIAILLGMGMPTTAAYAVQRLFHPDPDAAIPVRGAD